MVKLVARKEASEKYQGTASLGVQANGELPYEEVKKEMYAKHPKHSAYRSGLLAGEHIVGTNQRES